ncbi:MAG: GGDEF domain-containing protein [Candidatus Omnitrophota bacterium]
MKEKELTLLGLKEECEKVSQECEKIKRENAILDGSVEATIALFDMTKDIRKILDEDLIFKLFKERISAFLKLEDCLFLKSEPAASVGSTILPIILENEPVGFLVVRGLAEQDKEKFHILAQQFVSGVKGAFLFKKVQELTIVDSLTQTFNRRYFMERFQEEVSRCQRFKLKLSFVMADIDHFKEINDQYGHLVGDAILRDVTEVLKENIREIDFMGRYGGEELSIVFTETDTEDARYACERIRKAIESRSFRVYDEDLKVTLSLGLSTFPSHAKEADTIIERADEALYQAKEQGRNRVCTYMPPSGSQDRGL